MNPKFTTGAVPSDGFLNSQATGTVGYVFRPALKTGQRVSGTITITPGPGERCDECPLTKLEWAQQNSSPMTHLLRIARSLIC